MARSAWTNTLAGFGLVLLLVAFAGRASAVTTQRIASGLNRPIFATAPPGDDRLFIVEQRGVIKIWRSGQVLSRPFLDIDALVPDISGNDERGLLGVAFHPGFASNRTLYVNYINLSNNTVIARYTVSATDPDLVDASSGVTLLVIGQPFTNHNGGTLSFGPNDGYLYIGMGDGGGAGDPNDNGQRDDTLLGKMLRIDVDGGTPYAIPPTNPFVGPGPPFDEIWAKGLRNPYRWSFDRANGDLYVGDVGQSLWEEIDYQPASAPGGRNYGWRLMEGTHCYNPPQNCDPGGLTPPVYEYGHGGSPSRCSVIGGCVYRGSSIPGLQGAYFFADFCSNQIWSFKLVGGVATELTDRTAQLAPGGGLSIGTIAAFGEDGAGELYICDRGSGTDGEVYKIVPGSVGEDGGPAALDLGLSPAAPNPFSGATEFAVRLVRPSELSVEILDPSGRRVRTLAGPARMPAGTNRFSWDGRSASGLACPSGIYLLRAVVDGRAVTRALSLVR